MKQAKIQILAILILAMLPILASAQSESQPIDRIVALVEDDVILQSELDQAIDAIEQQVQARGESMPPRSVMEEQMLERLIMQRLQILRAERTGIRVSDADVDNALDQVAQRNNISLPQLRRMLEADGIEFEEFRREIRNEIITSRLQQRVVNSMDQITETEIDIALASDQFGSQEYLLSQIVIQVPSSASPEQVREAQSRVDEIYQQLEDGMTFSAAAISYSQSTDALEGGDVGWRSASALPRSFADAIENSEPGSVTEPLRTQNGFVILHVRDVRERSEVMVQEYRARHLQITPSELLTPEDAREQIQSLKRRIDQGEDFAELARKFSSDQSTANIGGLLDWFPAGGYGQHIQEKIDSLEPGEVSEPFSSPRGWHLVKLLDVREADRTREIRREEAREMISQQKSQEAVERFMRQLRSESFVENRL